MRRRLPSRLPSLYSYRSALRVGSILSFAGFLSILSLGSAGSVLSIGSAGSILSIGSAGSILSIGSAGSILSIGGSGSALSLGKAPDFKRAAAVQEELAEDLSRISAGLRSRVKRMDAPRHASRLSRRLRDAIREAGGGLAR